MTDVEAVVPPSSAIDCIARLGGLRAQPVFGEVGPAGGGRRIRNVDPSHKIRRSFRGKMRPKEIDRSGLEPPHHLSGTEGSNPVLSSGESTNHRFLGVWCAAAERRHVHCEGERAGLWTRCRGQPRRGA